MTKFKKELLEIFKGILNELVDLSLSLREIKSAFNTPYTTPYKVLHIKKHD